MRTRKIRLNLLIKWLVVTTVFCTTSVAWAGPLDRGEMQPRHNPAADSMLRVPGVLGQPERYALETLQRSGLNVNTKYIRQFTEKYAGRNGAVVRQIPSAGGIAMLGSSVTITVYKVEGESTGESGGDYGDSGGDYGDSGGGDAGDSGGSYGDSGGGYGDSGGGYGDSDGGAGGSDGDYSDSGGGYGDSGGGAGDSGGVYGDSGDGTGSPGSDDGSPPDDGSSGPDWGSPGADSGGDGSVP